MVSSSPGMVLVISGELTRFAIFQDSLSSLDLPVGSVVKWRCGLLVKKNVDTGLAYFLSTDLQWVWLIGDDHTFPPDIVRKLLARGKPCVVPMCFNRMPPFGATLCRHESGKSTALSAGNSGLYKLAPTETCGDAGMLLTREAVKMAGPPWQDEPYSGTWNVEDQRFVRKLQDCGVDVYYDFDNPMGHVTPIEIVPQQDAAGSWRMLLKSGGRPFVRL